MRFRHVRLHAPAHRVEELHEFYGAQLGLEALPDETAGVRVGETSLAFVAGPGEPFYHFALLLPGNRFEAALDWIRERATLLPDRATGDVLFDFENWDALACYFHDPAGNIVELIAHRGIGDSDREGSFAASELLGLSELGLVGNKRALLEELSDLGLDQWDGDLEDEARLAFVGEQARTFILSAIGRGWLPTGRPAEAHPYQVDLEIGYGQTRTQSV